MLKSVMLEHEMEEYLLNNGYDIEGKEGCINSVQVIEESIGLGYNSYILVNEIKGKYCDTLIFIAE